MRYIRTKTWRWRPAAPRGKSVALVPEGMFCLDCPYRRTNPAKPRDGGGFCTLLDIADWRTGGWIWDGVKACDFKDGQPQGRFGERRRAEAISRLPSLMTWRRPPFPSLRGPGWRLKTREGATVWNRLLRKRRRCRAVRLRGEAGPGRHHRRRTGLRRQRCGDCAGLH